LSEQRLLFPNKFPDLKNLDKIHTDAKAEKETEDKLYLRIPSPSVYKGDRKEEQVGWWYGRVVDVFEDYFTAVLEDLKGVTSRTEFDKTELAPSDLNLLAPDTKLSYTVTRVDKRSGREYVSKLSLSGEPIWTERDSKRAIKLHEEIFPKELLDF
jgi:hypothetical protein